MAEIYLRHPIHGGKVASTDMEAAHDRELGWEDFDPYEDIPKALPAFLGPPTGTPLPENFPAREWLVKAGYSTLESVPRSDEDLVKISGIGNATALKVLDALEG